MISDAAVERYLERIGAERPDRADAEALRYLQERHVMSVPFENIDYHVEGTRIHLDEEVLAKIVDERRGGGCYELNPAFYFLLEALGFEARVLPGRVHLGGRFGPPMCHLALLVELDEPWLVDVGFGKNSRYPLRVDSAEPVRDPHGEFRVSRAEGGAIDVSLNGKPQYRLDPLECRLSDFFPTLWWYRTAPDSPFLHNLLCTLPTEEGRVTLKGNRLVRHTATGSSEETLSDDESVCETYREVFGIELDVLPVEPKVDPAEAIIMQID